MISNISYILEYIPALLTGGIITQLLNHFLTRDLTVGDAWKVYAAEMKSEIEELRTENRELRGEIKLLEDQYRQLKNQFNNA